MKEARQILKERKIVGHSLHNDFDCLHFCTIKGNCEAKVRDLTKFAKYRNKHGQIMSLKNLTLEFLKVTI